MTGSDQRKAVGTRAEKPERNGCMHGISWLLVHTLSVASIQAPISPKAPAVLHAPAAIPEADECVPIGYVRARIPVQQGRSRIEIMLIGGSCPAGGSYVSSVSVSPAGDHDADDTDVVATESCPALAKRGDAFTPAQKRRTADVFRLRSMAGRSAAIRWLDRTLVAVRACWDRNREGDHRRHVIDQLYAGLDAGHHYRVTVPPPPA